MVKYLKSALPDIMLQEPLEKIVKIFTLAALVATSTSYIQKNDAEQYNLDSGYNSICNDSTNGSAYMVQDKKAMKKISDDGFSIIIIIIIIINTILFQETTTKYLLITEIGYLSITKSSDCPFDWAAERPLDYESQKESYHDFFREMTSRRLEHNKLQGVWIWTRDLPNRFSDEVLYPEKIRQTGYGIMSKPAEEVLKSFNKERIFFKYPSRR